MHVVLTLCTLNLASHNTLLIDATIDLSTPDRHKTFENSFLAAPSGFVWKLCLLRIDPVSGADSGGWTRFRIFDLFPVGASNPYSIRLTKPPDCYFAALDSNR